MIKKTIERVRSWSSQYDDMALELKNVATIMSKHSIFFLTLLWGLLFLKVEF